MRFQFLTLEEVSASCLGLEGLTRTAHPWRELVRLLPHKRDPRQRPCHSLLVWMDLECLPKAQVSKAWFPAWQGPTGEVVDTLRGGPSGRPSCHWGMSGKGTGGSSLFLFLFLVSYLGGGQLCSARRLKMGPPNHGLKSPKL